MRRLRSVMVASLLLVLGLAAGRVQSADYYSFGFLKTWEDAEGKTIGYFYQPCPLDGAQSSYDGDRIGAPTTVERWQCDPVALTTPTPCEYFLVWGYYSPSGAFVWVTVLLSKPCGF